ncbi:hypothetical protein LIER_02864 [Lithospermum erythrorhizon]|uniref:Uncharacterized protein n=1 Tax=Lithospermum erythrorhizon TaxID=34254 RepID=A0AAV3NR07_LITER
MPIMPTFLSSDLGSTCLNFPLKLKRSLKTNGSRDPLRLSTDGRLLFDNEIVELLAKQSFCGEERARVVFDDMLSSEDPILAGDGARKKSRTSSPLDSGPSNWMDRIDNEEEEI